LDHLEVAKVIFQKSKNKVTVSKTVRKKNDSLNAFQFSSKLFFVGKPKLFLRL